MLPATHTPAQALAAAQTIIKEKHQSALYGFAAGSILRGEGTLGSDLDLVVLYDNIPNAYRLSFYHDSLPVESFIHDAATLSYYVQQDFAAGRCTLAHMLATGTIIVAQGSMAHAQELQNLLHERLAAGPAPLTAAEHQQQRYGISDMLLDLAGARPKHEQMAILAQLLTDFGKYSLRCTGVWSGSGKHLARQLHQHQPQLLADIEAAIAAATVGQFGAAQLSALEQHLHRLGGAVFADYRAEGSADKRATPLLSATDKN